MNYLPQNIYQKTNNNKIEVCVPGSKSITARALLISAIANGESTLTGVQYSDDCQTFLDCIVKLGIGVTREGDGLKIRGCGGKLKQSSAKINVGSAGTAARFLPAFLAFQQGEFLLECSKQMLKRPVAPLIAALKKLGAKFTFLGQENCYPFIIEGTSNPVCKLDVDITGSSQFLSALLISSVCASSPVTVEVCGNHSLNYVDMTVKMMKEFGAEVSDTDGVYTVGGGYFGRTYAVEPDVSAAAYFYAINKILGTEISVKGISFDSLQGDIKFIELLKSFNGGRVDMGGFSDQALTLAAIAPYLDKPTEICNVAHIRGQECDRIAAINKNLTAMGVRCDERADAIKIYPSQPRAATIDTFGDHRVAMSFAITGLRCDGLVIENAEVCSKTFKNYFEVLDKTVEKLTI